jgi:ribosomal protein S18 acetylase RimI-like enzyme
MEIVRLSPDEADLFATLDRSEIVDGLYRRVDGGLLLREHSETITGWPAGLLDRYLPIWRGAAERGCPLLGARSDGRIVGLAVVNPRHRGDVAQLMSLYVDRSARRRGAAVALCRESFAIARAAGARSIYVSSSPTRGTVGFYWSMGFRPARPDQLDHELHALEPNDIHMVRMLCRPIL